MVEGIYLLRWLHILGATVLLGTGAGIAFFMLMAHRTHNAHLVAHVAGTVVVADFIFTATAVLLQPVTGVALAHAMGWSLTSKWILWSLALYVLTGLFWLPVVWIQIQLKRMAEQAAQAETALPDRYYRLFRIWFLAGFPAFFSVLAIIWLMITRPL